jgi:hypothetical protein
MIIKKKLRVRLCGGACMEVHVYIYIYIVCKSGLFELCYLVHISMYVVSIVLLNTIYVLAVSSHQTCSLPLSKPSH